MKRLIRLISVLVFGVTLATTMLISRDVNAVDAKLMGTPVALYFAGDRIQGVVVQVKKGWVNAESFELDIEITSVNGMDINHGHEIVELTTDESFFAERDIADILIDWADYDNDPSPDADRHTGMTYTCVIQVLVAGEPFGDPKEGSWEY